MPPDIWGSFWPVIKKKQKTNCPLVRDHFFYRNCHLKPNSISSFSSRNTFWAEDSICPVIIQISYLLIGHRSSYVKTAGLTKLVIAVTEYSALKCEMQFVGVGSYFCLSFLEQVLVQSTFDSTAGYNPLYAFGSNLWIVRYQTALLSINMAMWSALASPVLEVWCHCINQVCPAEAALRQSVATQCINNL